MKRSHAFLLICLLALVPGCAGRARVATSAAARENPIAVEGDFDDIDAVVAGVIPRFRMIEIPRPDPDPGVRRFALRGLDDTPGTLVFTHLPDGRIEIACTIGRFRDHRREADLVGALASRLTQLRGEVATPISDR